MSANAKTTVFAATLAIYLIFGIAIYFYRNRKLSAPEASGETAERKEEIPENINSVELNSEIESKLAAFAEAQFLFSASLKPADMFRLIANRITELIPFSSCAVFIADSEQTNLKIKLAAGDNSAELLDTELNFNEGLAGKTFTTGKVELDENPAAERKLLKPGISDWFKTAIAVPLRDENSETFGVLTLYSSQENAFNELHSQILKEISLRIGSLLANSLNYQRNLENSLKDQLTNLPNERAFYLVLENQVAESIRLRELRPLTVLSMDIKNFTALNKSFGHLAGNEILNLTARIIKSQLRQMDFLSRISGDEFLAILPTATEEVAQIIVERIEKAFSQNAFQITENEQINVRLNFGIASFMTDGETAEELMKKAMLKKQESKSGLNSSVIFFPREYVN